MIDAAFLSLCQMGPVVLWFIELGLFAVIPGFVALWTLERTGLFVEYPDASGFVVTIVAVLGALFFLVWSFNYYGWG